MGDAIPPEDGTYGIKGLPRPPNAMRYPGEIPYAKGLPVRKEISSLANSDDQSERKQWTLFVLALERFKLMPVDDKLSYFQIAGIHGYPEVAWDGAPEPKHAPDKKTKQAGDEPFGGYCNHNSLNFPAWHRPYMLLFEQRIWENMKQIVNNWTSEYGLPISEADEWYTAANHWRMPYWDWARRQRYHEDLVCPPVLTQGAVRIYPPPTLQNQFPRSGLYPNPLVGFENPEKDPNTGEPLPFGSMPGGKSKWNIKDNPIVHAELPLKKDCDWAPWSKTSSTSRYGIFRRKDISVEKKEPADHFSGLHGVRNCWKANASLAKVHENGPDGKSRWSTMEQHSKDYTWNPGSLSDAVNRMFSKGYNSNWGQFASTKWIAEGKGCPKTGYISLEYIHNNIHNLTGGSDYATGMGHMSDVPVAAFDPIFWLHHVQIDRLLAIWQCLNPKLWFDNEQSGETVSSISDDKETDPLEPFHTKDNDPEKEVWTAKACRDWTELNYQYDDLAEVAERTIRKHGRFIPGEFQTELRSHIDTIYPGTGHLIESMKNSHAILEALRSYQSQRESWKDYIINVVYDRYALDGLSYTIQFFLGGPPGEDTSFEKHDDIGQVYSFGGRQSTSEGSCRNCKRQAAAQVLSCAQMPLTIHLLHHNISDHSITNSDGIEEYLRLHLQWRVVKYGAEVISEEGFKKNFSKLQISVLCGTDRVKPSNEQSTGSVSSLYSDYVPLPGITDGKPGGLQGDKAHENSEPFVPQNKSAVQPLRKAK
ncbi:tyrosinase precursor [Fusarium pseudocircinatum]|uniref:tyrosinase n=1 Tax=Fusarium pseudocircinatum TaxID=56676 RepID=A0A8H5KLF1_9HYPO|nr:tyrosinase precursor [Fusarium pseudocircinatum]